MVGLRGAREGRVGESHTRHVVYNVIAVGASAKVKGGHGDWAWQKGRAREGCWVGEEVGRGGDWLGWVVKGLLGGVWVVGGGGGGGQMRGDGDRQVDGKTERDVVGVQGSAMAREVARVRVGGDEGESGDGGSVSGRWRVLELMGLGWMAMRDTDYLDSALGFYRSCIHRTLEANSQSDLSYIYSSQIVRIFLYVHFPVALCLDRRRHCDDVTWRNEIGVSERDSDLNNVTKANAYWYTLYMSEIHTLNERSLEMNEVAEKMSCNFPLHCLAFVAFVATDATLSLSLVNSNSKIPLKFDV
ncbi:hypothetical protein Tco_0986624 [Tanacetum coccineum]